MARMTDDRRKKRQRLSGSESSARSKQGHNQDAKVHEVSPASVKQDRSLRPRSKDSPPEIAKKAQMDERTVNNTVLPLHQQETTENSEEKSDSVTKVLPSMSGQHHSSGVRRKPKGSPDLDDLKSFIEAQGGSLEGGWHVDTHRSRGLGKLTKTFISPNNERFRSRVEVARHLGLSVNSSKKGELVGQHPTAKNKLVPAQMDQDSMAKARGGRIPLSARKKSPESRLRHHSSAKATGKIKGAVSLENGSKSPMSHEKVAVNVNHGLTLASDASKAIVDVQKIPAASIVTEQCQDALRSIISTDSFAALSNMLNRGSPSGSLESPLQLKALPLIAGSLDLQLVHLRLSNGVYGLNPELFSADIQQVWKNISSAGNELVAKAQSLSEFSDNLYKRQILSLFQGSAAKEVSEEKELLASTQHGKQSIADCQLPLENSHTLQENQLVKPPESTAVMQASLEKGTPGQETLQGSSQRLLKKDGAMSKSHKSKRRPKKASKSKRPQVLKVKVANKSISGVCKTCGLQHGVGCVVCRLCNASFHTHCMDLPSNSLPESEWCCSSCTANENAREKDKEIEEKLALRSSKSNRGLLQTTDVHNYSVRDVISEDSPVSNENVSTEHEVPENPSSLAGVRSPGHTVEHVAPKHVAELESPEASVESGFIEPAFLIENENACKLCGVENKKSAVSCTWCLKRFHLSCLQPPLKRLPRNAWYCPSCLCRVCKIDADDDKILLCDTCDEGYHTY
eukprot:c23503_g2_i2 orf=137-2356(+)